MTTIHATAEERIINILQSTGPCSLDEVLMYLPDLSWSEIFDAMDRMLWDGRVSLRRGGYSAHQIVLNREA